MISSLRTRKRKNDKTTSSVGVALAILAMMSFIFVSKAESFVADTISVRRAFIDMPLSQLELLNHTDRLNLLDYYEADKDSAYVVNQMEGLTRMTILQADYLEIELTRVSTLQIKVLPLKKGGNIVCAIYSINTRPGELAGDSEVMFFDSSMKRIDSKESSKLFKIPEVKDFFQIPKDSKTKLKELETMVPFPTVLYKLNGNDFKMIGRLTVGEYMDIDNYNIMKLFLRPDLCWQWDERKDRFELVK